MTLHIITSSRQIPIEEQDTLENQMTLCGKRASAFAIIDHDKDEICPACRNKGHEENYGKTYFYTVRAK